MANAILICRPLRARFLHCPFANGIGTFSGYNCAARKILLAITLFFTKAARRAMKMSPTLLRGLYTRKIVQLCTCTKCLGAISWSRRSDENNPTNFCNTFSYVPPPSHPVEMFVYENFLTSPFPLFKRVFLETKRRNRNVYIYFF